VGVTDNKAVDCFPNGPGRREAAGGGFEFTGHFRLHVAANQMTPITITIRMNLGSSDRWGVLKLSSANKMPSATRPRTINTTFACWFITFLFANNYRLAYGGSGHCGRHGTRSSCKTNRNAITASSISPPPPHCRGKGRWFPRPTVRELLVN